jgi:hypothetical protein
LQKKIYAFAKLTKEGFEMKLFWKKNSVLIFVVAFALLIAVDMASGQTVQPTPAPTPPVLATVECDITADDCKGVKQDFIDDANKAFELVVEYRAAVEQFKNERAKTDAERQAAQILINGYDELLRIKDLTIDAQAKLQLMYENFIKVQNQFIDKLITLAEQKQQRGFMGKLWDGFKRLAELALVFYAGRGF